MNESEKMETIQRAARWADASKENPEEYCVERRVPVCWNCGIKGHTRTECRKRLRKEKSKRYRGENRILSGAKLENEREVSR